MVERNKNQIDMESENMKKRKYKCTGCGEDRPCFLETNQEPSTFDEYAIEELKCVLDDTNQTSYNWEELNKKKG